MPGLRNRRARQSALRVVALLVVVALALGLLIGGIAHIGTASARYRRDLDRSFAAQATVVVEESNLSAAHLGQTMAGLPGATRLGLQQSLDTLVAESAEQSAAVDAIGAPPPPAGAGPPLSAAFAARARGVAVLRQAVFGMLGISPATEAGAAGVSAAPAPGIGPGSTLLPSGRAAALLAQAGDDLLQSDRLYAEARRDLAEGPGNGRIPASAWVRDPQAWSGGALGVVVDELQASPTLAPRHSVGLVTVSLQPAVVPPVDPSPGSQVGVVPPTSTLSVSTVVRNYGNVPERTIVVSVAAIPPGGRHGSLARTTIALAPGTSTSVDLSPLAVVPGTTYSLVVWLSVASIPQGSAGLRSQYTIRVAPATPASTTTTTTTAPRTTRPPTTDTTKLH